MDSAKKISSIINHDSLLQGIEGAILDLDGTLLDSLYVWRDAGKKYLASLGIQAEEDLDKIMFNMSMSGGARYIRQKYFLVRGEPFCGIQEKEIVDGINSLILEEYKSRVQLFPGALDTLNFFKGKKIPDSARAFRITAATTGDRVLEEAALSRLGIQDFFERIFYCSELGTSKGTPDIFLEASRCMNLPPEKIIVIDDSEEAISTARNAGFRTFRIE